MALRWDFKELGGTVTELHENGEETTNNWYEGNALMIVLNEYEEHGEEYYNLAWFFADVDHAKNCLGITKGKENMFLPSKLTKLTINRQNAHNWQKLIDVMTKAFPEMEIILMK